MKFLFSLLSILSFSASALDQFKIPKVLDQGIIVRPVQSARQLSHNRGFGSGIPFLHDGKYYLLTSDHVIHHSNVGVNHRIFDGYSNHSYPAQLVASDWSLGLALLQYREVPSFDEVPSLEYFKPEVIPSPQDTLKVSGFPFRTLEPIVDEGIFTGFLKAPVLFKVPELMMIEGSYSEFGMSGGGLFSGQGKMLGLLSHQQTYLQKRREDLNGDEFVFDLQNLPESKRAVGVRLLVIPQPAIWKWLQETFSTPDLNQGTRFFLPVSVLEGESKTIESGPLSYFFLGGYGERSISVSRANPVHADGRDRLFSRHFLDSNHPNFPTLKRWEESVKEPKSFSIKWIGFRKRTKECARTACWRSRWTPKHRDGFFKSMEDPEAEPIAVHYRSLDVVTRSMRELGDRLIESSRIFGSTRERFLALTVDEIGNALRSDYWAWLKPSDIDEVLLGFHEGWLQWEKYAASEAAETRNILQEARKLLSESIL